MHRTGTTIGTPSKDKRSPEDELGKRLFHLKTLFDASQEIGSLRDSRDILRSLLLNAIGGFGAARGLAFLADRRTARIETLLHRGFEEDPAPRVSEFLSTGQPGEWFGSGSGPAPAMPSSTDVPLFASLAVGDDARGGIGLGERITSEPYTADDRELLRTLAAHGESALRNARLLQQLERRVFHLRTLYDVSQEIAFLKEPQEILRNLLMMVMGTFGVVTGVAILAEVEAGKVEVLEWRGVGKDSAAGDGKGFGGDYLEVLKDFSRPFVTGVTVDPVGRIEAERVLASFGLRAWIPFTVNERLRGGIGLGEKLSGDPYTVDDQELLSTLSSQGAVAVENANLVERMRREEGVRVNFARYLSPQIVEKIVQHDVEVNLGGNRKVVTILFSDIRNFTTITEKRPPDQLVHILNEYFTEMAAAIFENQGSLDKYIGDAVVAVFGSLIPLENPARNAVTAAISMMKRLPELNRRWEARYGFYMNIGIGVNTGEVFLGNIGSSERMEFTVIGDAVNVASRLSGVAKPGQILVTRETHGRLKNELPTRSLPPVEVKGKSGKLDVYEVQYL